VRVPDPEHKDAVISIVTLRDTSLSTANCSEKHFVVGGHQYCHIMDPRTLHPVEGRLQAIVTAPSATDSDLPSSREQLTDVHQAVQAAGDQKPLINILWNWQPFA